MKTLYIDCSCGVCADMLVSGLRALGADDDFAFPEDLSRIVIDAYGKEGSAGTHGASYNAVRRAVSEMPVSGEVKDTALSIYDVIAQAESEVHRATPETVHFHEVGRTEAVINIVRISYMLHLISPDRIVCSDIHDGKGTIECSHGIIPVPVPAVKAMMKRCSGYVFVTDDVETEMVTPSGLASLIGMGAEHGERPEGTVCLKGTGYGKRETGKGGMEIYLIEE